MPVLILEIAIYLAMFGPNGLTTARKQQSPPPTGPPLNTRILTHLDADQDARRKTLNILRAKTSSATGLDRDLLVFDSNRTGNFEIFIMKTDGTNQAQLTNDTAYDSWWGKPSPDRAKILFVRTPAGVHDTDYTKVTTWVMNSDGTGLCQILPLGAHGWTIQGHGEWAPDGSRIVMCGTDGFALQLFVTDPAGSNPQQLTTTGGWNCDPSWSPDGTTIVFNHCEFLGCPERDLEIYTVPATGGRSARLTHNSFADYDPYFSPDGRQIAWLQKTNPSAWGGAGAWGIRIMAADGSGQRNVIDDGNINSKPAWSLDGGTIFFHRMVPAQAIRWRIFRIGPDGAGLTELDPDAPGNNEYPTN